MTLDPDKLERYLNRFGDLNPEEQASLIFKTRQQERSARDVKKERELLLVKQASKVSEIPAGESLRSLRSLERNTSGEVSLNETSLAILDGASDIYKVQSKPTTDTVNISVGTLTYPWSTIDSALDSSATFSYNVTGTANPQTVFSLTSSVTGLTNSTNATGLEIISGSGHNAIATSLTAAQRKSNAQKTAIDANLTSIGASDSDKDAVAISVRPIIADETSGLNRIVEKTTPILTLTDKPTVDDVSSVVENDTSKNKRKKQNLVNTLATVAAVSSVVGAFGSGKNGIADLKTSIKEFGSGLKNRFDEIVKVNDKGLPGFLQNAVETLTGAAKAEINALVGGSNLFSKATMKKILGFVTQGDEKGLVEASKIMAQQNDKITPRMQTIIANSKGDSITEFERNVDRAAAEAGIPADERAAALAEQKKMLDGLKLLDTTIGGSFVVDDSFFPDARSLVDIENDYANKRYAKVFTYVGSVEELDAEFTNITRKVSEVIVHATETFTNKDIGSEAIHSDMQQNGKRIGYHYVIRRDGRLQRGRPVNREGEHTASHNKNSIGIVMVGGINQSSGIESPTTYLSPRSFTRAQYTTLEQFLRSFYRRYPGGQVFGHNDIEESHDDPYFDIPDYVRAVFGKVNAVNQYNAKTNPRKIAPIEPEILNIRDIEEIGSAELNDENGNAQDTLSQFAKVGSKTASISADLDATRSNITSIPKSLFEKVKIPDVPEPPSFKNPLDGKEEILRAKADPAGITRDELTGKVKEFDVSIDPLKDKAKGLDI
jgi:N-acetylmuramoyl-L-alanine amidase